MKFVQYIFIDGAGDVFMTNPILPFGKVAAIAERLGYRAIPLQEWLERNNTSTTVDPQKPAPRKGGKLVLSGIRWAHFHVKGLRNIFYDMGLEVVKISLRGRRGPEDSRSAEVTLCSPEQASTALRSADWFASLGITIKAA